MQPAIAVRDLSFAYAAQDVLRHVSLSFEKGLFHAVLGPNGSGKTTLIKCVAGLLPVGRGRVFLNGRDLARIRPRERARCLAHVPQKAKIEYDFSVQDIVLMGRYAYGRPFSGDRKGDYRIAQQSMEWAGVYDLRDRKVTELSGGEQQRVVIARALAQQSGILLLDEPISNLDVRHQVDVLAMVRRLVNEQGATAVCVLHDINLAAAYADRILLMDRGASAGQGEAERVLDQGRLSQIYGLPLRIEKENDKIFVAPEITVDKNRKV